MGYRLKTFVSYSLVLLVNYFCVCVFEGNVAPWGKHVPMSLIFVSGPPANTVSHISCVCVAVIFSSSKWGLMMRDYQWSECEGWKLTQFIYIFCSGVKWGKDTMRMSCVLGVLVRSTVLVLFFHLQSPTFVLHDSDFFSHDWRILWECQPCFA